MTIEQKTRALFLEGVKRVEVLAKKDALPREYARDFIILRGVDHVLRISLSHHSGFIFYTFYSKRNDKPGQHVYQKLVPLPSFV